MKIKNQIIFDILISLNQGSCSYTGSRVNEAIKQYNELVERGIVEKEKK